MSYLCTRQIWNRSLCSLAVWERSARWASAPFSQSLIELAWGSRNCLTLSFDLGPILSQWHCWDYWLKSKLRLKYFRELKTMSGVLETLSLSYCSDCSLKLSLSLSTFENSNPDVTLMLLVDGTTPRTRYIQWQNRPVQILIPSVKWQKRYRWKIREMEFFWP